MNPNLYLLQSTTDSEHLFCGNRVKLLDCKQCSASFCLRIFSGFDVCFWWLPFVLGFCHSIVAILTCASVDLNFLWDIMATLVVVGQALLVPLALHGPRGISKAVAWHALRVWPLWWCPNFWCTWTPNVGYPGESGICAPCSTGIAWASTDISKAVAWHALRVLPLWWYPQII